MKEIPLRQRIRCEKEVKGNARRRQAKEYNRGKDLQNYISLFFLVFYSFAIMFLPLGFQERQRYNMNSSSIPFHLSFSFTISFISFRSLFLCGYYPRGYQGRFQKRERMKERERKKERENAVNDTQEIEKQRIPFLYRSYSLALHFFSI